MKKIIFWLLLWLFICIASAGIVVTPVNSVETWTADSFVNSVVEKANSEGIVVRTKDVNFNGWWVKSTLDQVTKSSITSEYINWFGFFALSVAVVLIIYNWVLLISSRWNDSVYKKVQTRLVNIIIWIIVIFAGYMIIRWVISIMSSIFK